MCLCVDALVEMRRFPGIRARNQVKYGSRLGALLEDQEPEKGFRLGTKLGFSTAPRFFVMAVGCSLGHPHFRGHTLGHSPRRFGLEGPERFVWLVGACPKKEKSLYKANSLVCFLATRDTPVAARLQRLSFCKITDL